MAEEVLTDSLQESILAVLTFKDAPGQLIAAQVTPEHFDGVYREVASAVLAYRQKYQKAPGAVHLESLFSRAKLNPGDRKTHALRRTLVNLSATAEVVNADYAVARTQDHIRSQKLKAALLEANERYLQGGEDSVEEVEGILNGALRFRQQTLESGSYLYEVKKASIFSEKEHNARLLGIPELDRYGLGPTPKRMLLYIGPKNTGKSWWCVHVGKQCLLQKDRVLHVTLEMPEEEVLTRYYQSFFGLATQSEAYAKAVLEFDELDRLKSFKAKRVRPKFVSTSPADRKLLIRKVETWKSRFKRLKIKEYASGTLTMNTLRGYLDYLELVEKFVPTVLIVDYPDLFKLDSRDLRISLGRVFVDLRGIATERNMAVVAPTQSGRDSIGARKVGSRNVTEDISKVFTADTVITFSQTELEAGLGLGRLFVEHARNAPKGHTVLLTQSYPTGQYLLQSSLLSSAYWEKLESMGGSASSGDEDSD